MRLDASQVGLILGLTGLVYGVDHADAVLRAAVQDVLPENCT
jgi:hypothetical protein